MSRRVLVVLVLGVGLLLAGCAPYRSLRTCEEIAAANLRALIEETTSLEQGAARVAETFHVPAEEVRVLRSHDNPNDGDIEWRVAGVHYTIIVKSSSVLSARMTCESRPPSAGEVIQCLGAPDRYWAYYYPRFESPRRLAELHFFFPALGITCWGYKYGTGDRPPQFHAGDAMEIFDFVLLGSSREVMDRLLEKVPEQAKEGTKPWPGDWREVKVQNAYD